MKIESVNDLFWNYKYAEEEKVTAQKVVADAMKKQDELRESIVKILRREDVPVAAWGLLFRLDMDGNLVVKPYKDAYGLSLEADFEQATSQATIPEASQEFAEAARG